MEMIISGHDWLHIERVYNMALFIHKKEVKVRLIQLEPCYMIFRSVN